MAFEIHSPLWRVQGNDKNVSQSMKFAKKKKKKKYAFAMTRGESVYAQHRLVSFVYLFVYIRVTMNELHFVEFSICQM